MFQLKKSKFSKFDYLENFENSENSQLKKLTFILSVRIIWTNLKMRKKSKIKSSNNSTFVILILEIS